MGKRPTRCVKRMWVRTGKGFREAGTVGVSGDAERVGVVCLGAIIIWIVGKFRDCFMTFIVRVGMRQRFRCHNVIEIEFLILRQRVTPIEIQMNAHCILTLSSDPFWSGQYSPHLYLDPRQKRVVSPSSQLSRSW